MRWFCAWGGLFLGALGLHAGQILCPFDGAAAPAVNDFGERSAGGGPALSAPGTGCPAHPGGQALDVSAPAALDIPLSPATSLAQGTLEAWVRTRWDWATDRDQHTFLFVKMEGGQWHSIALYHHGRMGEARTLAFNIHDGVDNCITCPVERLGWRAGEWHHIAASWTEHSAWLFADGRLVARRLWPAPMYFSPPAGPLQVGPPGLWGSAADALLDEVRFSDLPLYVGMETIPDPAIPLAVRGAGSGAPERLTVTASSTAPPWRKEDDVPELHDGVFGQTVWLDAAGEAWLRVDLPQPSPVAGVRWSRDGRPLAGPNDWAEARHLPRDFAVEVSPDGLAWQPVLERKDFWYDPDAIPRTGMVFEHRFPPVTAAAVRMRVTGGQPGPLGPRVALDEIQVLDPGGENLARQARVTTPRSVLHREYAPANLVDGRLGEASCWRAGQPGEAVLTLTLPAPREVRALAWSRSGDGLMQDGVPQDLVVEALREGVWVEVGRVVGNRDPGRRETPLEPVVAGAVRVRILSTVDGREAVLDEITLR